MGDPVLLFLHGGPGMPEHWLTGRYPTQLAEPFTVAWWEQRGAGLSYHPGVPAATMTNEQIIADTLKVAMFLARRFGVEKVHLTGHSWRGRRFSRAAGLRDRMLATDLTREIAGLPVPVHLLHGRNDRTVSYRLARSYSRSIEAPLVGFSTFQRSAHSPAVEEPDRTLRIATEDVLAARTGLADPSW